MNYDMKEDKEKCDIRKVIYRKQRFIYSHQAWQMNHKIPSKNVKPESLVSCLA